mmetsp:Transcript_1323/g.1884  ORF Transcript_1323/g.1884 Transcript_1323/m.1884 type:complete len:110 (-) Transcript_1323:188-517(-)
MAEKKNFDVALKLMGVTQEQFDEVAAAKFKASDKDKSGKIEKKELAPVVQSVVKAMIAMGEKFSKKEEDEALDAVMKAVDANKSGDLDEKEFGEALKLAVLAIEYAAMK